jgi:hypothetical protein
VEEDIIAQDATMDTLSLVGNLASIIGVGASGWSVFAATGARKAAREAKNAVHAQSAADEFKVLLRLAGEYNIYVRAFKVGEIAVRGRDLMSGMVHARGRWVEHMTTDHADYLDKAISKLEVNIELMKSGRIEDKHTLHNRMMKEADYIMKIIAMVEAQVALSVDTRGAL